MKINISREVPKSWYIKIDKKYLTDIIEKAIKKFTKSYQFYNYLDTDCTAVKRWLGIYRKSAFPTLEQIEKLVQISSIDMSDVYSHVEGFKIGRGGRFLVIKEVEIDESFIRNIGLIIGDGCITNTTVRISSSEPKIIKSFIDFLKNLKCNNIGIYLTIIKSRDAFKLKKVWSRTLKTDITAVYKKPITTIRGKIFRTRKECVEIFLSSKSLAFMLKYLLPKLREIILHNKQLQKAYLQGIFSAEGSVTYREKNNYRVVQIDMRNEEEIKFISKVLPNFNISFCGPKEYNGMWYIHITNQQNLRKLVQLDIFTLHPVRKIKLENVLQMYKIDQVIRKEKEKRFFQIGRILESSRKTAEEVSQQIKISLCRTQVLLKDGYDKGLWKRMRKNGYKSSYIYFF